jgi:hypothetical protein
LPLLPFSLFRSILPLSIYFPTKPYKPRGEQSLVFF